MKYFITYCRSFLICLKSVLKQTWNSNGTRFQAQWEDLKSSYKVRQISGLFCHLTVIILGSDATKFSGAIYNERTIPRKNNSQIMSV